MEFNTDSLLSTLVSFPPFMIAIVFHEAAHAWMASRHGDSTARDMGRETLNPLPHMDIFGTLIFPLISMLGNASILFGWAKPVPINYNRLKPYRRGLFLVSIAGIAMNILIAFLSALGLVALNFAPEFYLTKPLMIMATASISINYSLAFFNLLPLPPLDGSKAIEAFLSYNSVKKIESLTQYSFFILMALLLSGVLNLLRYPILFCTEVSIGFWFAVFAKLGLGGH